MRPASPRSGLLWSLLLAGCAAGGRADSAETGVVCAGYEPQTEPFDREVTVPARVYGYYSVGGVSEQECGYLCSLPQGDYGELNFLGCTASALTGREVQVMCRWEGWLLCD
jgi:hypothetical protein